MNRRFTQLLSWLFTLAAGLSLGLLIFSLSNGYFSLDAPQFHRAGPWEFTWDSLQLTAHRVSPAEETYRQQIENRAIVELWFEGWRTPIDYDIQRLPWNSEPYLAAKARFAIWHDAHAAYERVPMAAAQNWIRDDRIYSLGRVSATLAVLPLVWCIVVWQRVRERAGRQLIRWFRWEPAERIGWLRRAGRAAFLGVSLTSLLLASAVVIVWIRSHYSGDNYVHTETMGTGRSIAYNRRQIYTFVGGISVQTLHMPQMVPQNRFYSIYNQLLFEILDQVPRPGRPPKPAWTRPNPGMPIPTPWYGVQVDKSLRPIPGVREHSVQVRWWVPFASFCVLPAFWLLTHLRFRQLPATGYCFTCGYDLTGNTSGICPECGSTVPTRAAA